MKKVFSIFVVAIIALPFIFSSCAEEDPAQPLVVDKTKSGTLSVNILAVINTTTTPTVYAAAPITLDNVVAWVNNNELNSSASGRYLVPRSDMTWNNGVLTINAPTTESGVTLNVNILPALGTRTEGTPAAPVPGIWSISSNFTGAIYPGNTTVLSFRTMNFTADKIVGSNP